MGNGRDEQENGDGGRERFAPDGGGQGRVEDRQEKLAVSEVLDDAVVVGCVVVGVEAGVRPGADREEADGHHGANHQGREEETRQGEARLAATQLQIGCN